MPDRRKGAGRLGRTPPVAPPNLYSAVISLLDIVGPVMVGPSSSHTAGACRLSRVARALLEEEPVEARFELHSAFAKTMRGHGTDRALVAGALGMEVDDAAPQGRPRHREGAGLSLSSSRRTWDRRRTRTASRST